MSAMNVIGKRLINYWNCKSVFIVLFSILISFVKDMYLCDFICLLVFLGALLCETFLVLLLHTPSLFKTFQDYCVTIYNNLTDVLTPRSASRLHFPLIHIIFRTFCHFLRFTSLYLICNSCRNLTSGNQKYSSYQLRYAHLLSIYQFYTLFCII